MLGNRWVDERSGMTNLTSEASRGRESTATHIFLILGVMLFIAGVSLAAPYPFHTWTVVLRWIGIAVLALAGVRRSTLTYWIFLSMLLGIEIGLDRPQLAEHLTRIQRYFFTAD